MSAKRSSHRCLKCGYEAYKWLGRCPGCGEWNSFEEVPAAARPPARRTQVSSLREVAVQGSPRIESGLAEFDRVLGGGAVPGSVILLGGDPGIGKSTLLLQVASALFARCKVLYVSGEESLPQLKLRAQRLGIGGDLQAAAETDLDSLLEAAAGLSPDLVVVDSVQSFYRREIEGVPGSVAQVREVAAELVRLAKESGLVVFLIGHVTKEGTMAGPRLLEHMVDVVLYLEGDRYHSFRILRGVKNRFGSTHEIGVFMMEDHGLREVVNPSHLFITQRSRSTCGAVVTASMEGTRPLLVEIQALVTVSNYTLPRRTSSGIDLNRVALIMAVLERHAGISFMGHDTFVSSVGGVRLQETAVDLAVAVSLASSIKGRQAGGDALVIGEVGLTGEILPVSRIADRIQEGKKLGFKQFIIPAANMADLKNEFQALNITGAADIEEAVRAALLG